MQAYICTVCGFLYDIESAELTQEQQRIAFEDLDPDWTCPVCGVGRDFFGQVDSDRPPDVPSES